MGKVPFVLKDTVQGYVQLDCAPQHSRVGQRVGRRPESPGRWAPVSLCSVTGLPTEQHGDACDREL